MGKYDQKDTKRTNLFDKREQSQARLSYAERRKVAYEIRTHKNKCEKN